MRRQQSNFYIVSLKSLIVFVCLSLCVLLVNAPYISFDMMYFEQPTLYLANQKIMSLSDLLHVYLHPQMLDALSIPFFRPSGHYLIYQILTTFLDWHNTKGFLIVNFLFLALACYTMIRLYALLFPRYRLGAYVACGIYLMHPALLLSRISPMHFEFACVSFVLLGLYCFISFSQQNHAAFQRMNSARVQHYFLLIMSLFFYFLSVTFKEPALMLGPVMMIYLSISLYQGRFGEHLIAQMSHQKIRQIHLLLIVVTLTLATYLSMALPVLTHPLQGGSLAANSATALVKLLRILFGFDMGDVQAPAWKEAIFLWDNIIFTPLIFAILWSLFGLMVFSFGHLFLSKQRDDAAALFVEKKSFLFLLITLLAFLILPVAWGRARPWHLALSLVFASLMMGFSFDYICRRLLRNKIMRNGMAMVLLMLLGIAAYSVEVINTNSLGRNESGFPFRLDRNAVLHAPDIRNKLNADSVVIVEDSLVRSDYYLGNSTYPLELYGDNIDLHRLLPTQGFYTFPYVYGGSLFKWAYLMPALQEQIFPFEINKMEQVSQVTIYNWLRHYDNIFCVGYDKDAVWHDRTLLFKKNLWLEKIRRHLVVNQYKILPALTVNTNSKAVIRLPFVGDVSYCQFRCDGNKACEGFTYAEEAGVARCYFDDNVHSIAVSPCKSCQKFMKLMEVHHV